MMAEGNAMASTSESNDTVRQDELQKVENVYSSFSSAKERKEQSLALIEPYSDWPQMLAPALLAIALLGELMLISTKTDFSLEEKPPRDGFKYLRHPNSFRASLVQITNIGWEAFNKAHTSMDQIRLYTLNVDSHLGSIVRILKNGTDLEVDNVVPKALKKLQYIADTCVTLSADMESQFDFFYHTTAELLEVSTSTKSVHEEKRKETEIAIKVAETQKEQAEKEKQAYDEEYQKITKDICQAQTDFKEALKSGPSTLKLIGCGFLDTVFKVVRLDIGPFSRSGINTFTDSNEAGGSTVNSQDERCRRSVYKYAEEIYDKIRDLEYFAKSGIAGSQTTFDWNEIEEIKAYLDQVKTNIAAVEKTTDVSQTAMNICEEGIQLSEKLIKMKKALQTPDPTSTETLKKEAKTLLEKATTFLKESAKFSENPFLHQNGHRKRQQTRCSSPTLVQAELTKYQVKVDGAKEALIDHRNRQERLHEDMKDNSERIMRTLLNLSELDIKTIDFEKIRETLVEGINAIVDLRKQWSQLTKFFKTISTIVKVGCHLSISDFIDKAQSDVDVRIQGSVSDTIRNEIYENAFTAGVYANFVGLMSSAYVEVSSKHLTDDIAVLGRLITLDPETDQDKIQTAHQNLLDKSKDTQKTIEALAEKRRKQCSDYLDSRIVRVENELKILFQNSK